MADEYIWPNDVRSYVILGEATVEGRLSTNEFETVFLHLYKQDHIDDEDVFQILDSLFGYVDEYIGFRSVEPGELGPVELVDQIKIHLGRLRGLAESRSVDRPHP
jgi:hypothetical protein